MSVRSSQGLPVSRWRPLASLGLVPTALLLAGGGFGCSSDLGATTPQDPTVQGPGTGVGGEGSSGMADVPPGVTGQNPPGAGDPQPPGVTEPGGTAPNNTINPEPGINPTPTNPAVPGTSDPSTPNPSGDCSVQDVGASVLRRLSRLEYQFTLQELFQLPERPAVLTLPPDSDFKGFRTLAALQNVTTEHLRAYQEEATLLAEQLLADAERSAAIIGCDVGADGCLESFVTDFGRLAYRRSLTADEISALLAVAVNTGGSAEEQFTAVVAALLSSADFLFRIEVGDSAAELTELSGEELAARLSFTLIGRGPSSDLLAQGASGELDSEAGLVSAVQTLLTDQRSQEYFDAFFQQWLGFETLRAPNAPDASWNDALLLSMGEETGRVLREYAWGEGQNFFDALTANHTFIRADLAEFYGLPAPAANGRVEFPAGHNRESSGLLTHAALISAKRDGDRIAHRGAWIQRSFLCVDLEVPTALLDEISDELDGLTYQQMLDRRNSDTACAGCHAMLDPIGVGFAQYDEIGKFDPSVDIAEFGITPALPGPNGAGFASVGELASLLRGRAELASCLTDQVFLYLDGREAAVADDCRVSQASERFASEQHRFASLLEGLVLAPEFRLRRAPAAPTP